jgi:hypothetical protein
VSGLVAALMVMKMSSGDIKCGILICKQKAYNLLQNNNLEHNLSSVADSVILLIIFTILAIL